MRSSTLLRREPPAEPAGPPARVQDDALAEAARHEAANDAAAPAEYRPNPLWAVNGAVAAFFVIAAIVLASD